MAWSSSVYCWGWCISSPCQVKGRSVPSPLAQREGKHQLILEAKTFLSGLGVIITIVIIKSKQGHFNMIFRMEDAIDAFKMIFDGGQYWLPSWLAVYTLSVSLSFYSGWSGLWVDIDDGTEISVFQGSQSPSNSQALTVPSLPRWVFMPKPSG